MNEKHLTVVGVQHDPEHVNYQNVVDYVKLIEPDRKVSLEYFKPIDVLLRTPNKELVKASKGFLLEFSQNS